MRFGWVVAAAALVMGAGQAQAADFLTIKFDVSGYAYRDINATPTNIHREGALNSAIEVVVAAKSFGDLRNEAYFGPTYLRDTYVGDLSDDGYRLSETTGSYTKGPNRSFDVFACGSFAGLSGSFRVAVNPLCSTVTFGRGEPNSQGGDGARFQGVVTQLTVTEYFGTPERFGLINGPVLPVPEPASWAMMILGAGAIGAASRKHRRIRRPLTT